MQLKETVLYNGTKTFIITPDEGKVLVRKSDGQRFGTEIYLGYTYYLNGEKLDKPLLEVPEDYFEDDMTEDEVGETQDIEDYVPEIEDETAEEEIDEPESVDESLLTEAKKKRIRLIEAYDKSIEVDCFYYNDIPMWLNLDQRIGLTRQVDSRVANGEGNVHLVWTEPNVDVILPCGVVSDMLNKIEVYAGDCTIVTNSHINEVSKMTNIEEVNSFDITKDYPPKIHF